MKQNYVSGVVYPLGWLTWLKNIDTMAELKTVATVWAYDGVIGIETEPLTFTELQNRSGLSKRSLDQGIKRAIENGYILSSGEGIGALYFPNTKSIQHVMINTCFKDSINTHDHELKHEHGGYFLQFAKIHETLRLEFGMERSVRVADDLCSGKYSLATLETQVRYVRWEVKRGRGSNPRKPIKNPAGYLITRLKENNYHAPSGFNLLTAMVEDEGWTQGDLFMAIYNGDQDLPAIRDTFAYSSWLYEIMEVESEAE